jgi:Zn-dependent metalloprotease
MRDLSLASCVVLIGTGVLLGAQSTQPTGTPRRGVVAATSDNTAALRSWDATVDSMSRSGELVLSRRRTDTVLAGRTHERYQQYVRGIRVIGGEVTRQSAGGVSTSMFGELRDVSGVAAQPRLSADSAREVYARLSTRDVPANRPMELVIVRTDDGRDVLAYSSHVWSGRSWLQTYIDAQDGRVLLQYDDLKRQAAVGTGTGVLGDAKKVSTTLQSGRYVADDALRPPVLITYDMQGNLDRTYDYLDGFYDPTSSDIAGDTDNKWTDAANVDAHAYVGYTYDYYFKRFGRKGLDDHNTPIYSITHPVRRTDLGRLSDDDVDTFLLNAFWCGGCGPDFEGVMVFGEGLPPGVTLGGQVFDYFAGALDVVSHELTHGLTEYTSNLIYRGESGALNESFSDILGTGAEFFYQAAGTGLRQADYLIGEDIIRPGGLRSMSNPGLFGDPDHYSRRYTGSADGGGVHTNSGIPNHAFYLAIEGGTNRTSGLSVSGVGGANREQIEKVFYRAFTFMLPANATFSTARTATIQAARDLYGANSAPERAVTQAWTAVGVN